MSQIKTAIIPVAGYGSRMLPITKAIEKCMLPVGNRPIIDYVVQDCLKAGVTNIIFVVGEGSEQLQKFYGNHPALEQYLKDQGKDSYLPLIQPPTGVTFSYVEQAQGGKYGTAVPVALAAGLVAGEDQVLVLMGDDFIWNADDSSEVGRLLAAISDPGEGGLLGVPVPQQDVSRYGVIKANQAGVFESIVEKPSPEAAPSNLINVSKYVLPTSLIAKIAEYVARDDVEGEYMITEPINEWVGNGGVMRVTSAQGQYLDGGNPTGWLHANNYVAEHSA
jgi:UTP--glucose-1-phosphate uridylyltransferase